MRENDITAHRQGNHSRPAIQVEKSTEPILTLFRTFRYGKDSPGEGKGAPMVLGLSGHLDDQIPLANARAIATSLVDCYNSR
jgi:hypothetical protein